MAQDTVWLMVAWSLDLERLLRFLAGAVELRALPFAPSGGHGPEAPLTGRGFMLWMPSGAKIVLNAILDGERDGPECLTPLQHAHLVIHLSDPDDPEEHERSLERLYEASDRVRSPDRPAFAVLSPPLRASLRDSLAVAVDALEARARPVN